MPEASVPAVPRSWKALVVLTSSVKVALKLNPFPLTVLVGAVLGGAGTVPTPKFRRPAIPGLDPPVITVNPPAAFNCRTVTPATLAVSTPFTTTLKSLPLADTSTLPSIRNPTTPPKENSTKPAA